MKKLFSACLALVLTVSLMAPAYGYEDLTPPLWQQWGYGSLEEYLSSYEASEEWYAEQVEAQRAFLTWTESYKAAHASEVAAFDAEFWLEEAYGGYWTKEEYMSLFELKSDAEFAAKMMESWLYGLYSEELTQKKLDDFKALHADEVTAFDADAYFTQRISWWGGDKASYMESVGLTDEAAFFDAMLFLYIGQLEAVQGYKEEWAALLVNEPERTALFLSELNDWLWSEYSVHDLEGYKKDNPWLDSTCDEELYIQLFHAWNAPYEWEQTQAREREQFILERGGVPGTLGIMRNEQYLSFPEGRSPYYKNQTVYADAETLSTALGVEIPAPIDGYVSIRTAAESAGLTVFWDEEYQTVVLLDLEELAAGIDEDFTILNGLLAQWKTEADKNYQSNLSIKANATMFDSLDGDKTGAASVTASILQSAEGLQVRGSYDLSQVMSLILSASGGYLPNQETVDQTRELLKSEFEYRLDLGSNAAYLKAAALTAIYARSFDEPLSEDTWFSIPEYENATIQTLFQMKSDTYGKAICAKLDEWNGWWAPVEYYDALQAAAVEAASIFGDGCFVQEGANWTLTLTNEDYTALENQGNGYGSYMTPDQFALKLTLKPDGVLSGNLFYQSQSYYDSSPVQRVTADFTLSLPSQKLTLELHTKNTYKATITLNATTTTTTKAPAVVPPEGANIVEN